MFTRDSSKKLERKSVVQACVSHRPIISFDQVKFRVEHKSLSKSFMTQKELIESV